MSLLEVEAVDTHYGDFQALYGVSLEVSQGEALAVVGANGAGKTTLMRTLVGLRRPTRGVVRFDGRDLSAAPPHRRVAAGIALTPEGRRIFPNLTVEENLLVGAYARRPGPWDLRAVLRAFPLVADIAGQLGRNLSGGQQQATAIARALMSNPRLLLLDEVSLGLAPVVVEQIYQTLPRITEHGTTVRGVEQDVNHALRAADRVHCLLEGRTVLEAAAADVTRGDLATAYFGI